MEGKVEKTTYTQHHYKKPLFVKEKQMVFTLEIVKGLSKGKYCFQCSSCHGCSG